jgi:mannan endo-1,4-beta-mannosidase
MRPRIALPAGAVRARALSAAALLIAAALASACADDAGDPTQPPPPTRTEALDPPWTLPGLPCKPRPMATSFVRREGGDLLLDGRRFRAVGANLYYLQQLYTYALQGQENIRFGQEASRALDGVLCADIPVVRAWAFNDGSDTSAIRSAPGRYNELGLRGLDRAVAESKARGLRVILTLVNNHDPYGGLAQYARWAGKRAEDRDDFFGDPVMMGYWKDYVATLAARVNIFTGVAYRDEPAILAWEIANELRCRACRNSTRLADTVRDLARFAKRALPNHLIGDGGEGFDDVPSLYPGLSNRYPVGGDEGAAFHQLLAVEELDLVSYHMYPSSWMLNPTRDVIIWIDSHQTLARMAGKVAYLGEFGHDPPADRRDEVVAPLFNAWLAHLYDVRDGQLGLLWQWVSAERLATADDGFGIDYDRHPRATSVLRWWANAIR